MLNKKPFYSGYASSGFYIFLEHHGSPLRVPHFMAVCLVKSLNDFFSKINSFTYDGLVSVFYGYLLGV